MKRALSAKNLWLRLPRPGRAILGRLLGLVPQPYVLGPRFCENLRFVRAADRWTPEQTRAYQLTALRSLCALAYEKTPFYRRQFDSVGFRPQDLNSLDDLRRLPTIDKNTVREHLDEMCARPLDHRSVDSISTGGSSGAPLLFHIGRERSAIEYAYLVCSWERAGYRLDLPTAEIRGRVVQPDGNGLRHEYDPLFRRHYYSAFHMTDENMRLYLDHIRRIGPCFLHVYPSSVANLARFIRRAGLARPDNVLGILAGSENVYPDQRKLIEDTFGVRCFSWYGHTEKLILAAECAESADYHVWPTYGFLELLDDRGEPVTAPGQRGEIVGTGFINTVVPFIRYRTGDRATYVADRCEACGRQHPIIRDIRGHRTQEVLVAVDGSEIPWTAVNMHDDTFRQAQQFQLMQEVPGRAVLRLVPASRLSDAEMVRIRRHLETKLRDRIAIEIELCDRIPTTASGKAVYVDQRLELDGARRGTDGIAAVDAPTISFSTADRRTGPHPVLADAPRSPDLPHTRIVEPIVVHKAHGILPSAPLVFLHPVRKFLAFLAQEGPVWTWRKAACAYRTRRINAELALVVVVGRTQDTGRNCVACGRQFSSRLPHMLFRDELVFEAEGERQAHELSGRVMHILQERPLLAQQLLDFSHYSPEPAPVIPGMSRAASAGPARPTDATAAADRPVRGPLSDAGPSPLILVGAGAYAVVFILPCLRGLPFDTVVEYNPLRARVVGRQFGFSQVECDYRRVLARAADLPRPTVVIANYHSHHAQTAIEFLEANPHAHVMIEKPAVVGHEQFERLLPYVRDPAHFVEIGFNRRYTRMVRHAKRLLAGRHEPLTLTCIVSEDAMEPSHWYFWRTEGTRVYGNLCHWIDLGVHLIGAHPVEITALADRDFQAASCVTVRFADGSLLNLVSGDRGDRLRGVQEHIEVHTGQTSIQIHDFRKMVVLHHGRRNVYRSWTRDKGHAEMYRVLSRSVLNSDRPQYSVVDFVRTCVLTEEIHRMLASGERYCRLDPAAMDRLIAPGVAAHP